MYEINKKTPDGLSRSGISTRKKLNKLIRKQAFKTEQGYDDLWKDLYEVFEFRYGLSIKNIESRLDYIEQNGLIEELYQIAQELYPDMDDW